MIASLQKTAVLYLALVSNDGSSSLVSVIINIFHFLIMFINIIVLFTSVYGQVNSSDSRTFIVAFQQYSCYCCIFTCFMSLYIICVQCRIFSVIHVLCASG